MIYLWLKAGHIIFMVFWLAGLFMLPRQMIYMHPSVSGSEEEALWAKRSALLGKIILAPSLIIVSWLLDQGARIHAFDPEATVNFRKEFPDIEYQQLIIDGEEALRLSHDRRVVVTALLAATPVALKTNNKLERRNGSNCSQPPKRRNCPIHSHLLLAIT